MYMHIYTVFVWVTYIGDCDCLVIEVSLRPFKTYIININ